MKKIYFSAFLLMAVCSLTAQPVLTNSMNFDFGDTYRIDTYNETTIVDPGNSGANINWDFTQISGTVIQGVNALCVNPSTTPFADSAIISQANTCTRNADYPNAGAFMYYTNGNSSEEAIAMGYSDVGNNSFATYLNPQTFLEFPFTYGNVFNDTYEVLMYHIDMGYHYMRDSVIVTAEADAYGTIHTEYGTFQNVLRIKRTSTEYFWYKYAPEMPWSFNGIFISTEYEWYSPNIKVPLFSISIEDGVPGNMVKYLADYNSPTSVATTTISDINLYPIPANKTIHFSSPLNHKIYSCAIYSLSGDLISNESLNQNSMDISHIPSGLYIIELQSSDGIMRKKIIIN